MLLSLIDQSSFLDYLIQLILRLPVMLFSLSVHETMHGFVAWKLGDPTARNLGRLTLNPRKHIDPIGLIVLLLVGIGWAKPVPVNARYFKNPKWGFALVALAGPLSNFLLGIINAALHGVLWAVYLHARYTGTEGFRLTLLYWLAVFFLLAAAMNFVYSVFNMIPIPPYDGSRILFAFLPQRAYFAVMRYERQIMLCLLLVLVVTSYLLPVSPFSWVAGKLTDLIANPVSNAVFRAIS